MAVACEVELHPARPLVRQADLDLVGQRGCLAEVDEVLEGECKGYGLAKLDLDTELRLLDVAMLAQRNRSIADVSLAGELDAVLIRVDRNCGVVCQ